MNHSKKAISVVSFFAAAFIALSVCQSWSAAEEAEVPTQNSGAGAIHKKSGALINPALATEQAPDTFRARFSTTKGDFVIEVHRDWAPQGADRFYNLVKIGYFNGDSFFRVVKGFMVQFGINGSPKVNDAWHEADIPDDPAVGHSNSPGMVTFATAGPNTRTTQIFINYGNNSFLDTQGFVPFGEIITGLDVVQNLYGGYGDGPPSGSGPDQGQLQSEGNSYLQSSFPQLDSIKTAAIVGPDQQLGPTQPPSPSPSPAAPTKKPWWE